MAGAPPPIPHLVSSTIARFAFSGVDLFFVLSGFLIGGILIDHRDSARYFRTFYARRVHRILPIYLVMAAVFAAVLYTAVPRGLEWLFEPAMPLWTYLTFTQNIAMARAHMFGAQWMGATWSLAVEEQFYLLLPPIILGLRRRGLGAVLVALIVMAPVTRVLLVLFDPGWGYSGYLLMPARADALMLGVFAAWMLRQPHLRDYILGHRQALRGTVALLALAIAGMALMHESNGSRGMVLYGYTLFAVFYAAVLTLAVTAEANERVGRILRARILRRAGVLAYGVYLFHIPFSGLVALVVVSSVPRILVTLAVTFAVAQLSWTYFEQPLVRRGHRYTY